MGAVYKALQPQMNRMVAVKILHPKLTNRPDLASRFRREARAMSHLTHPNTVKVFVYGELEDGSLYIVMEFLEGKNLNQTVRAEGPMAPERAVRILAQVCAALEEAHRAGIIHRDLKPENIFLCKQGGITEFAKVLDFGLAKVTEREMRPGSLILTQEGMVFGTPEFMSPEQAQGKTLGPASDIYSLAVILYEALTGKLPFESKNALDYIMLHVSAVPTPIADKANKEFPPLLWPVISKALSKKPEDRFASALDFGEALKAAIAGATEMPAPAGSDAPMPSLHQPSAQGENERASSKKPTMPLSTPMPQLVAQPEAAPPRKSPTGLIIGVAVGCMILGMAITAVAMTMMK
jgi:serine/threonine-protein kinase